MPGCLGRLRTTGAFAAIGSDLVEAAISELVPERPVDQRGAPG